jgi:deoxyribodipyrimidine photolyase-related protein
MNQLIFPPQLFYDKMYLKELKTMETVYLIEEPRYFTDFKFHKLKLAYHRASMKKYYDMLKKKKINVKYIEYSHVTNTFYKSLGTVSMIRLPDFDLENKLIKIFKDKLTIKDNLNFLIKIDELPELKKLIYKNNKYSHDEFYKYQRRKLDIMIKKDKPEGGKWSYDSMNRLPLPKNHTSPEIKPAPKSKYIKEAITYVEKHFPDNYGELTNFIYPIETKSAIKWLHQFLEERLKNFGKYEDAVDSSQPFLYHSVLSPMMNIGILTDTEVVNISYTYYKKHSIPIESYEGFIRQVIGWRNYVYTIYLLDGEKMRTTNHLKHKNPLPYKKFWEGTTNMLPIDDIIKKINKYAYAHHIERLMYLGNFMLLCMIEPDDVYKIFMEWTIDSYDWVMVPNVYGMSQYASPNMMTRPYFSSSNYITKMSNYKRDDIWDSLYYNFINMHYDMLKKNYATAQQVKHWDNKTKKEQEETLKKAKDYLHDLLSKNK